MTARATNRDKAREVYRLANDLYDDLIIATRSHQLFSPLIDKYLVENPGILRFRNTVAGHLYDKEIKKALTAAEVSERANAITQDNLEGFFLWVNNKRDNSFPKTVVSIVARARDLLQAEHQFSRTDLH